VVLGANHPCPWKCALGNHINPTNHHALSDHHSQPVWTFSKTRRSCSDTALGHGQRGGGPVKTDEGCLSPGLVYEFHTTFTQSPGLARRKPKRSQSTTGPRMRSFPVPPSTGAGGNVLPTDEEAFGDSADY
jgi:hypothetical protein